MSETSLINWACAERVTIALIFTDIVGSTTLNRKLGNRIWNEALSQHEERVRDLVFQFGGREIKSTGDGFMIIFHTVVEALDFALELHANTGHSDIRIRAGIHVGAVRIKGNDIQGGMVNFTARIVSWRTQIRRMPGMHDLIVLSDVAKEHIEEELGINPPQVRFLAQEAELKDFGTRKLWIAITPAMRSRYAEEQKGQSTPSTTQSRDLSVQRPSNVSKEPERLPVYTRPKPKDDSSAQSRPSLPKGLLEEIIKKNWGK